LARRNSLLQKSLLGKEAEPAQVTPPAADASPILTGSHNEADSAVNNDTRRAIYVIPSTDYLQTTLRNLREKLLFKQTFRYVVFTGSGAGLFTSGDASRSILAMLLANSIKDGFEHNGTLQMAYSAKYGFQKDLRDAEYSVFWISAFSMKSFEASCLRISKHIPHLNKKENDPKQLVKDYLSEVRAGKWLLIWDQAEYDTLFCHGGLFDFLPSSHLGCLLLSQSGTAIAMELKNRFQEKFANQQLMKELTDTEFFEGPDDYYINYRS
jgi:hypothetical protein